MLNLPSDLKTIDFSNKPPSIAKLPQAYLKALSIYVSRNSSLEGELLKCFKENNLDKLFQLIHALKGASGNLGMQPVFEQAALIEKGSVDRQLEEDLVVTMAKLVQQSLSDAQSIIDMNPVSGPTTGRPYDVIQKELVELLQKSALVSQELIDEFKISAKSEKTSEFIEQVTYALESFDYDKALRMLS